jgi:hypothetical protein
LVLKYIEFNATGVDDINLDNYAVFKKCPLVTFTSPNFSIPLTVNNALTYADGGGVIRKVGDVNGISTMLDVNFSTHTSGTGGTLKCAMSKPGPPHWVLATINNSFTIQPMYLLAPNSENYLTTSDLSNIILTFGGNVGSYILTFEYDAI